MCAAVAMAMALGLAHAAFVTPRLPALQPCHARCSSLPHSLPRVALQSSAGQGRRALPELCSRSPPVVCSAVLGAAAVRGASSTGAGFWQLLAAFTMGGLFFSSVLAVVGVVYAFGKENVRRAFSLALIVAGRVLALIGGVLQAARLALLSELPSAMASADDTTADKAANGWKRLRARWSLFWGSLRWSSAWAILKEGVGEARRTAAQGVEAIRQEAEMYAAVVGPAGLAPIQYALDRLTPLALSSALHDGLSAALAEVQSPRIKSARLRSFSAGSVSPRLLSARAYDLGDRALAFDVEIDWRSGLDAEMDLIPKGVLGARVPISVRNVVFAGTVRLILAPLVPEPPGFGAALISFVSQPEVGLEVRVAGGEVTRLPWLRAELQKAIEGGIAQQLLWPRRLVIPTEAPQERLPPSSSPGSRPAGRPNRASAGAGQPHLLPASELAALRTDDPLLQRERELSARPNLQKEGYRGVLRNATVLSISLDEDAAVGGTAEGMLGVAGAGSGKGGAGKDFKRHGWPW